MSFKEYVANRACECTTKVSERVCHIHGETEVDMRLILVRLKYIFFSFQCSGDFIFLNTDLHWNIIVRDNLHYLLQTDFGRSSR